MVLAMKNSVLKANSFRYLPAILYYMARVALEAGNSPEAIFAQYRELVTLDTAKDWFGVISS
jgi:hypothetical protein